MFGTHDGVAIVGTRPDSLGVAGISAAISSTGTIRSETHELFSSSRHPANPQDGGRLAAISQRPVNRA